MTKKKHSAGIKEYVTQAFPLLWRCKGSLLFLGHVSYYMYMFL